MKSQELENYLYSGNIEDVILGLRMMTRYNRSSLPWKKSYDNHKIDNVFMNLNEDSDFDIHLILTGTGTYSIVGQMLYWESYLGRNIKGVFESYGMNYDKDRNEIIIKDFR